MDRTGKIAVGLSVVFLMAWMYWTNQRYGSAGRGASTNTVSRASNAPGAGIGSTPPATPLIAADGPTPLPATANAPEQTLTSENANLRLVLSTVGGGLKEVELLHPRFTEEIACGPTKQFASTNQFGLNRGAPNPAYTLDLGDGGALADHRISQLPGGLRAVREVPGRYRITKDYLLGTNQQFEVIAKLENLSGSVLQVPSHRWNVGTGTPVNHHDPADQMGVAWYDGNKDRKEWGWVSTPGFLCIPTSPRVGFTNSDLPVVWAAPNNRFFALITVPDSPAKDVAARRVDLPPPSPALLAKDPQIKPRPVGVETHIGFPATNLAAGQTMTRRFSVFAGPKEYYTLQRLEPRLDLAMDLSGFSGFFAKPLLLAMNGLHRLGLGYGLCIIAITVIIKLLFWPLTAASTRSMKRMGELQPQMKLIQERYKDDPKKMQEKTMHFLRENRINPAAGCLPILIQIPVFFGLFAMLRGAIELRGASFLWMCDLSAPDTLFIIPGIGVPFNLMPLIYIATALWQTHLTPISPQMDPASAKLMRYMPLMFLVIFYGYSCGLALYWTVQNLLSILQMKLTSSAETKAKATPVPARR